MEKAYKDHHSEIYHDIGNHAYTLLNVCFHLPVSQFTPVKPGMQLHS